jgi:acyl-CoA dehydrogenase
MDFRLSNELSTLRARVRTFVDDRIIPAEARIQEEDRAGRRDTLERLRQEAKTERLFVPHLPRELGGLGLGVMGMCVLFREMGRSPYGAKVFNCDAPDQGNMDLLLGAGDAAQKQRYLLPLARAEITSAFCMTEPAPGAGADPSNLMTRAVRDGESWKIEGRKWFSTGGDNASFLIVMARTSDDERTGATMFLVDRRAPGVRLVRNVPVMAPDLLDHKEAEIAFDGVIVEDGAVLGGVGAGFRLAQQRLVPARLTHCMRWLGLAERTLEMCKSYLLERKSFGRLLAEHQQIQAMVAESASAIHAGNLITFHAAWMIEDGRAQEARAYSSMAKNLVANALCRVLDDAIQMHGAKGYSDDLPFARWYLSARAARIADGPDEVHRMLIARELFKGRLQLLV